jgi:hypothetical protein
MRSKSKAKSTTLGLTQWLHKYSFAAFTLFFAFAIWAFWTSYYKTLFDDHPPAIRMHGTAMTLWCVLLIGQALLIRLRKNRIHRFTGKLSYVLVPFILWSGAHLARQTITQSPAGSDSYYYMIALMYNSLIVFAILYGLAIWHRKNSALHARYMACTLLPLITPVTDRLIYKYFDFLISLAPTMPNGMPMVPALGFALGDFLLIILLLWDWRRHGKLNVFPFVLGLLILYHASVLTFYKYDFWKVIAEGMMKIPV